MSTEVRNWDVVAKAMEASGATSSQMYQRAKALAQGKLDPMPTSFPEAPYSISAIASWSQHTIVRVQQCVLPPTLEDGHMVFTFQKHSGRNLMATAQAIKRYVIRYLDSFGDAHEDNVYASDAMEAQNLAMEFNDELNRRPQSITAILQSID